MSLQLKCACGTKAYDTQAAAERALAKIQRLALRTEMPKRVAGCGFGQWHLIGSKTVIETGPDRNTRALVKERDDQSCALCGEVVLPTDEYSLQHRKARGSGGTTDRMINSPANLVLLHGSAATRCHLWCESRRTEAEVLGFVISKHSDTDPATVPIHHRVHGGFVLLDNAGGWSPAQALGGAA